MVRNRSLLVCVATSCTALALGWLVFIFARAPAVDPTMPEQVHLALGRAEDSMTVAWATGENIPGEVEWGESESSMVSRADGDSRPFFSDYLRVWHTHIATMTGLKANARYYYRVKAGDKFTETFSFMNRRAGAPYKHLLMGDMGASAAFSLCTACSSWSQVCDAATCAANTAVGIVSEVGTADMVLHLGDFAYDLDTDAGRTGDQFMRNIEQVAARVPYMVNHGNHEGGEVARAHYIERFRSQPSNADPPTFTTVNGETTNTMYFSWDHGLVHWVTLSTEFWFGLTDTKTTKQTMLDWLRTDLVAANANREAIPWIVVQAHRSIYCSCDGDCDGPAEAVRNDVEEILMDFGVDFFINAHEHNYERTYPIYQGRSEPSNVDPKAPIYIVSGSAGNREMHEPFRREQPSWSAFRSNTFSYSLFWTHNSTHVHWQQVSTDPTAFPLSQYGAILDDVWIVQNSHGPFDRSQAPQGEAFPTERRLEGVQRRSVDHWLPLLGIEDDNQSSSEFLIEQFRAKHGEFAWKLRLDRLKRWAGDELGADIVWRNEKEDTLDRGSGDCTTCGQFKFLEMLDYSLYF